MKKNILLFITIILFKNINAQTMVQDSIIVNKMVGHMLEKSVCYSDLRVLCKEVGHRISGSAAAAKAVEWGRKALLDAGCDRVYLQPVMVPHWVRSNEKFGVTLNNGQRVSFNPLGLGNTLATKKEGVTATIIEVDNEKELEALGIENVKGKVVFFNYKWNQKIISPFGEYGNCVYYRWAGPSLAAKYGAVACIIRGAGSAYDNFAHTGSMRYDTNYNKIPAMALSYVESNMLEKAIRAKEIKTATMISYSHFEEDVKSYNVIGEIIGTEKGEEIITIGGHLDSWDVGEGAHDDGAGCVQCIDVMRTLKTLDIKTKRTIRCVLFMNEENGLRGGTEYARVAKENNEKHLCAIETDAGGFSPRGFEFSGNETQREKIKSWDQIFLPLGLYNFSEEGGGADISPLHRLLNTPMMELMPDPQRYFDIHHTNNDVFEQVNRRELSLGAGAMAAMVYMLSEHGL
jgi:carboxypeptidase Q